MAGFAYPAFINTGMRLGLAPVTGLSLPLVSSGGSALFATLIELGLLQNNRPPTPWLSRPTIALAEHRRSLLLPRLWPRPSRSRG